MNVFRAGAVGMLLAASGLLTGCLSPQHNLEPDFGRAVRNNIVAQVADPEPEFTRQREPASNGVRAASANDRYQRGQVIQPQAQSTSSVASSGGSGAPSGGGQSK